MSRFQFPPRLWTSATLLPTNEPPACFRAGSPTTTHRRSALANAPSINPTHLRTLGEEAGRRTSFDYHREPFLRVVFVAQSNEPLGVV